MSGGQVTIPRTDWTSVVAHFARFFGSLGDVSIDDDVASFTASDTGFELRRDGTSRSFMPLHELGARWDEVVFDWTEWVVEVRGEGVTYRYRVPPRLVATDRDG